MWRVSHSSRGIHFCNRASKSASRGNPCIEVYADELKELHGVLTKVAARLASGEEVPNNANAWWFSDKEEV